MNPSRCIFAVVVAITYAGSPVVAGKLLPERDEQQQLRAAIEDLTNTFADQYPKGREYLARLDRLTAAMQQAAGKDAGRLADKFETLRREALIANPLVTQQPILFVARRQYLRDHHNTATIFQPGEINEQSYDPPGLLKSVDLAGGCAVRTILDPGPTALIRDPEVSFDGQRVVFSMRTSSEDSYHIYEAGADGTDVQQLTSSPGVSDIDPLYLPDGSIVMSSTRNPKYCGCNRHIMANLFKMNSDGSNIHQIGKSTLFEGHGALLPDGRILYYRWEYIDRNFGDAQGLWTVNPDGTNHAIYWGNNTSSPGAVFDARPIPGTQKVICIFGSCHDRPWGAMAILDRSKGIDATAQDQDMVEQIWPEDARRIIGTGGFDSTRQLAVKYEDPYPLSDKYFLCSRQGHNGRMAIYLVDVFGNEILLHADDQLECFDPMPLGARPRPPVVPSRRHFAGKTGQMYVLDVYQGTNMTDVEPGAVKYLRIVEQPAKRAWTKGAWKGQGAEAPAMNWHNFENKKILGTVPVEKDGSAYFEVPADAYVFFQLLDKDRKMIHSMRTGTIVQQGETTGCIGCHDHRLMAPVRLPQSTPLAMKRSPSRLNGWYGPAREFSYVREVQPVLDRHCVQCHDLDDPQGGLVLAGDKGTIFNASYAWLHTGWRSLNGKYITTVGAGPSRVLDAYEWGSHRSKLIDILEAGHEDVKLSTEEMDRLATWIDINAPYYAHFESAYPEGVAGRSPLSKGETNELATLVKSQGKKKESWPDSRQGFDVSFDRPELSPPLTAIRNDRQRYEKAIAIIRSGAERLESHPRADMPGFQPAPVDQERIDRYCVREQVEAKNRLAIQKQRQLFDKDTDSAPR